MTDSHEVYAGQWEILRRFLPEDLDSSARAAGAMRRKRGQVTRGEDLLRLLLMHIAGGLSLEQTVARAAVQGLPKLNAMALHKRLCTSHQWLAALTGHLLEGVRPLLQESGDCWNLGRRVRVLDATDVQEPGSSGTDWRVHYSLRLPEMCCDFFELTDKHGGESLRRLPVKRGDLVLVDRAYNDRQALGQIIHAGGDVILRYHSTNFPLLSASGQRFDLLKRLRRLPLGKIGHWPVSFMAGERRVQARICALRKTPEQTERARRKIKAKMRSSFERVKPATLEYAEFIVVVCTVPAAEMSARVALEFYRARWQVELAFKRLKSLLHLGQLPKKKAASCRAWMQGKILTALLIERLMCEQRFFSPWGYRL
ncbi:MAG: IS4 family transposase [Chthoniobacterales bacterium]